jgi:hydroxymethylpyrimidine/phosphomethylpyrimidine kinase
MNRPPIVLCIGGHDPTGGAGIQADIETLAALGPRAVTLVTALTAQDTHDIRYLEPVAPATLARCFDTLVADIRPDAVKIGLLASVAAIDVLVPRLQGLRVPLVVDPVLAAGGGFRTGDDALREAVLAQLLPLCTLTTPNRAEARRLAARDDADAAAERLLEQGCGAVLVTGADDTTGDTVENRLWLPGLPVETYHWPRLDGSFHGSGCTLASACAAGLASGQPLSAAVVAAQRFTHDALARSEAAGGGQHLPNRRKG